MRFSEVGYEDYDREEREDPREAFFEHAEPCHSCGRPCDSLQPAAWDSELMVGPCCLSGEAEAPEEPICQQAYSLVMLAKTAGQMVDDMKLHVKHCAVCQGARKGAQSQGREAERRKDAA